jgi:phage-related protein
MASGPTIVAKFIADTKDLTSGIDKAAGGATSKLKGFAGKAGLALGGAFAIGAVVKFGKASVDAASDDAESQANLARQLQNTTGATQDQIDASEKFIANLSKQTSIADDDLRPAMGNLVRGFGNAADAQTALALATDISAGTGKDLGTVSEALAKAANGQTGALGKLGIKTKDASGHAKSLDDIMGDLSKTFGGQAATAADTTAGKMRGAAIQFGEFQEQIGTAVLPLLSSFAEILTKYVIPALSAVAKFVQDNISWIGPLAVALGIVTGAVWLFNAALAANPIVLIAIAIAGLVAAIILAYNNVEIFRDIVDGAGKVISAAFGFIMDAAKAVFDWIKDHWPLLLAILTGPIGAAVLIVVKNWDTIKAAAQAVWDWISSTWSTVTDLISKPISAAVSIVTGAWDSIKGAAVAVWDWFTNTWSTITSLITGPIQTAKDIIVGIWDGVVGTITGIIDKVIAAMKTPINLFIKGWNALDFTVGGGSVFGIDVPKVTIGMPDIPLLASGGVLTSPTLFVGGEAGTEIVAPEEMLRAIIRDEAGGNSYVLNMYPRTADSADVAYAFRRLELMAGA